MARLIELCGCPGVGKSTIYQAICSKNKSSSTFIPSHQIFKKKINFSSPRHLAEFLLSRFVHQNNNSEELKKAGDKFISIYSKYIDACWSNIYYKQAINLNGLDLRFEKAAFMYTTIQQVQYINDYIIKKNVLHDEGLIHRIGRALYRSKNSVEEIDEIKVLISQMPLPYAVIHVELDEEENVERLLQRKKLLNMHRGLKQNELYDIIKKTKTRLHNTCLILEEKGIRVLRINSKLNVDYSVNQIISFIDQLQ